MSSDLKVIEDREASLAGFIPNQPTASIMVQMAAAVLDKRIATARNFPRSISRFKAETANLLREDVETARSAEYAKPVGGGRVTGPSVRLAELAAMCWGNLEVTVGEPTVTDKSVVVKATAWDMERNYAQDGMATASILDKQGRRFPPHLIETLCLATASKAKRNAILAVIPRAYVNELLAVAKAVADGSEKPLEQRRAEALDHFARTHRVQPEQIFDMLGVAGADDLTADHLTELRAVATAIKEGSAVEDFFGKPAESKTDAIKAKLADRKKAKGDKAAKPLPAADPAPSPPAPPGQLFGNESETDLSALNR